MAFIYSTMAFVEILALFASIIAIAIYIVRSIVRSITEPKLPPPKPEDLRHLKRAGQSGFY
ncbi:hypothetical protein [Undibacter mobilis]|uniref:Uncharacterized protein n=1 Tax=Undibacter mobilis TaxID=2292256 RepID=A0A371B399_9BRAD|nr:hypothetical protein [Undibacter mobilis]RDV01977.1 hypothetical protein DXH78_15325 [Undibacter mobilis]